MCQHNTSGKEHTEACQRKDASDLSPHRLVDSRQHIRAHIDQCYEYMLVSYLSSQGILVFQACSLKNLSDQKDLWIDSLKNNPYSPAECSPSFIYSDEQLQAQCVAALKIYKNSYLYKKNVHTVDTRASEVSTVGRCLVGFYGKLSAT